MSDAEIAASKVAELSISAAADPLASSSAASAAAVEEKPHPSGLSLEERYQLCRSVAEECISEDELRRLLRKDVPVAYDGFEPSGRMHIAQGVMKVKPSDILLAWMHGPCLNITWFLGGGLDAERR